MSKTTILFIHQSSELYGSDKTLLYLVRALNNSSCFNPIVVLPAVGPLSETLDQEKIRVIITPVIKVSRKMFKFMNIFQLPLTTMKSLKKLKKELMGERIDIIHSNTLAVLLGAIYSRKTKIKHIWHVHEIIEHPKIISMLYPILVDRFSDHVVYNSRASKEALCKKRESLVSKSQVVWNGLDRDEPKTLNQQVTQIRESLFKAKPQETIIGLVGRINRWKGHTLLLEAFNQVLKANNNIKLVFVGSTPPNQEFFKEDLCAKITALGLDNYVEIIPFHNNVWPLYDSLDIVVVPSTEPEPFGLVAIEAMLSEKITIAANHGGLSEIIQHNKTGLLFTPNSKEELIKCLAKALQNKMFSNKLALAGLHLAKTSFSLESYVHSFKKVYAEILTSNKN